MREILAPHDIGSDDFTNGFVPQPRPDLLERGMEAELITNHRHEGSIANHSTEFIDSRERVRQRLLDEQVAPRPCRCKSRVDMQRRLVGYDGGLWLTGKRGSQVGLHTNVTGQRTSFHPASENRYIRNAGGC